MTSEATFLAKFPAPTLTPIGTATTQPTYLTTETAQRELNANAISVHSYDGGGLNGHLALTLTPAAYLAVAGVPYIPRPAPTAEPVFVNDSPTGPQKTEANCVLLVRQKTFKLYHDVDRALVRQILAATPIIYLQALHNRQSGRSRVSTIQMLTHLRTHYGQVTMEMKDGNSKRMMAAWQRPTPIDTLFQQLDDGIYFANAAGEPLVDTAVARMGYNTIHKTGIFSDPCRDWSLQEPELQSYANFQVHFRKMDNFRRVNATTSASAGYQAANQVSSNNSTAPSHTSSSLSSDPASLHAEIAILREQLALASVASSTNNNGTNRQQTSATRGYCWTHGSSGNVLHTSATCSNPAPGHQIAATNRNCMGGSSRRCSHPSTNTNNATPTPAAATPPA